MARVYNLVKDREDLRDIKYASSFETVAHIPTSVDLRAAMSPIVDQGQLGSCVANAIACGLKEFRLRDAKQWRALSRLDLYWNIRNIEGTIQEDAGGSVRDGMKVVAKLGVCPEYDFPYDITTFTDTPSAAAKADAAKCRFYEYHSISNLTMLKAAVAARNPVVIGMEVYPQFESDAADQTGLIELPKNGEQSLGGHAVLVVGYDDKKQVAIVRNSWGADWGDQGYFYLPYSYWTNGYVWDMWTGK